MSAGATHIHPSLEAMYEAQVRYEVTRLSRADLDAIRAEVDGWYRWMASVTVADVASPEQWSAVVRLLATAPLTDRPRARASTVAVDVHTVLAQQSDTLVEEILPDSEYERLVTLLVGMDAARAEAMRQLTSSTVYSRLVAHVMVFGIKGYLTTENVLAKKIPGAQSLARLGQKGLNAAVPNMDAQLVSAVNANIKDTVRESQRYLDRLLDEKLMRSVADEIRANNAQRTVADLAALIRPDQVADGVSLAIDVLEVLRQTPLFEKVLDTIVASLAANHADQTLAELLDESGITQDALADYLTQVLRPAIDRAAADGHLETRARARLAPFYEQWSADLA